MSSSELFDLDQVLVRSPAQAPTLPAKRRSSTKAPLVGQDAINIDKWRKRIEAEARPGESYQQAAERLKREEAKQPKDKTPGREAVKPWAGRKQVVVLETQLDFWIATGLPAIPKDERPTMEHPIYAVEDGDTRQISYEHNGNKIEIIPSVAGRATQHDKDIVLFCVSKLVAAINAGIPVSPVIETTAHELLSFTRSSTSERGYELLSKAFDRLTGTRMRATFESTKDRNGSRRWVGLLDDVEIITRGAKNRMCAIRIKVSDTTYNAATAMDVLTIPGDYFGLRSAIAKRIYELCRKHCGDQGQWKIGLALLQKKVGSAQPEKKFRARVKELAEAGSLLDYFMTYLPDEDAVLFFNKSDAGKAALLKATRSGIKKPRKAKPAPAA
ncbi:TPA: replication initiator protein A [Pseudomonas aeruginosa]|uniref:replication initiator protein A n=1 Tax=Pseudomonas aeruginosa TaxID=287 RepID=UPI001E5403AD|nr:replication initiator protein A [Pseudomonas aeruginosa]UHP20490.1 RepA [Pseudomonas aeruginosa]HCF6318567.1 replication initiator protein A [Pseudomonas aeruginosa]HCF6338585.1 replication initiator protein A [Pseudomonas aeruginosa]HCF6345004.1 replication initiator protein A [Pseudomonas aeruginosa]HCF6383645.1 replication initiator protein A [Pseudomonas aeruginosa]